MLYGPISVAMLFYLDITSNSGMTTRLLLPTVPFFPVTLGLIIEQVLRSQGWLRRISVLATVTMIVSVIAGQQTTLAEFHNDARVGRAVHSILQQRVSADSTLLTDLQRRITIDATLLSCQPLLTSFYLKRPVPGLLTSYFNTNRKDWTAETTLRYIDGFQVGCVLLLANTEITNDAQFFQDIEDGRTPIWLRLEQSAAGYRLFRVVKE